MTASDVSIVIDAIGNSRPARALAVLAGQVAVVGFIALMAAAIAVDVACGRDDEWPSGCPG